MGQQVIQSPILDAIQSGKTKKEKNSCYTRLNILKLNIMKVILYRHYGPPDVLEYVDIPRPIISTKKILVKVHATSVNPVDWKIRSGKNKIPGFKFPKIPGSDISGEIVEVGKAVTRFKPGDFVYGMLFPFSGGACAEYAAIPEKNAAQKPKNISFLEAATVPIAGLAALQALRNHGKIQSGNRVLINGASGGVGSFAVQIAKVYGAEVTAVTSKRNMEFVKSLGADHVLDYSSDDFTKSRSNFNIIFDAVANRSFAECKSALSSRGAYITTLPSLATIFQLFTTVIFGGKQVRLLNVWPRSADLDLLREWLEDGKIHPCIDRTFLLSQTSEAHAYSETGHARGKIVILVND